MLISHKYKFVFIHVFKVAGTSIREALSPYCQPGLLERFERKITGRPKLSFDFDHHIKASEVKDVLGEKQFNAYFKFAFVRNPWDWQVSLYHFTLQNPDHFQHEMVKNMSFEKYIEWRVNKAMCYQSVFTHDQDGKQLVNYIGKIENINNDFKHICNHLKIDCQLPFANKSIHDDYMKYYDSNTYNMIAEAYKKEIKLFGYSQSSLS